MKKALPLGAKIEAIRKAIKSGQKFYLHTYVGEAEVVGMDNEGTFAMAKGRTWAISSTDINRWYGELTMKTVHCQKCKEDIPYTTKTTVAVNKVWTEVYYLRYWDAKKRQSRMKKVASGSGSRWVTCEVCNEKI